ncbi:MAG: orotate phosphoribosyltransferase [Gemmatimonadales bacterium]
MSERAQLKSLLLERSVRLGEFVLASGAKSDYYIDARTTTMCAEGQRLVGLVGLQIIRERALEPTHVGGLTMGADPIAYAIAHRSALEGQPIDGFSVRKRPKDHGTGQRVEGGVPKGARCLIVEDTMTTGRSSLEAVEAVRAHGADVVGVLALVNRSSDAAALYDREGIPLVWVFTGEELLKAARG